MGQAYTVLLQYERAIPEFEKALEMDRKRDIKPWWPQNYTILGRAYHATGQFKNEKQLYKKAIIDFPENPAIIQRQGDTCFY